MVHPYIRRREGKEPVHFPTPALEKVLGKTLGVPLFQEQAMQVAMVAAGFSATEADQLRRSMATFKFTGGIHMFQDKLITGMLDNGYSREFAERTFKQLEGFGSYGFPESHAASFALIAYASSWMKCHHPDVFLAAILNAQPMGFYAPAQLVRDARDHGVEVRPVDVNLSDWDCSLEPSAKGAFHAVRLGFCMVRDLNKKLAEQLVDRRTFGRIAVGRDEAPFETVEEVWRRASVPIATLNHIAKADGFRGLGLSRREAAWAIKGLRDEPLPLFAAADDRAGTLRPEATEPSVTLSPMTLGREVVEDYRSVQLSLRAHPLAFLRPELERRGIVPCAALRTIKDGRKVEVAGIILVRQRPGSTNVTFVTIEDETGIANAIIWQQKFEEQRRIVLAAAMVAIKGTLQREGDVIHVIADRLEDMTPLLHSVGARDFPHRPNPGDGATRGGRDVRDGMAHRPRDIYPAPTSVRSVGPDGTITIRSRDFH